MRAFEVICMKCFFKSNKEQKPYKGLVNHNYIAKSPNVIEIQYRCFNCEEKYDLEINAFNPKQQTPIDKEDFKRKNGIKEVIKN